jgi:hypothetical protein
MSESVFAEVSNLYKKAGYLNLYGLDLIITIVICVVFLVIMIYFSIINNLEPIKADWDNNKCRPSIIPFAGIINKPDGETVFDFTQKNFIQCGQIILRTIVDGAFSPLYNIFKLINGTFISISDNLVELLNQLTELQFKSSTISGYIYNALMTLLIPLQTLIINIKDIFNKLKTAIVVTLFAYMGPIFALLGALDLLVTSLHILIAFMVALAISLFAAAAAAYSSVFLSWLGIILTGIAIPVQAATLILLTLSVLLLLLINDMKKAANTCFDPETRVMTQTGVLVAMKDLELNTVLKNGARVVSVMKINNLSNRGNIIHKMYEIDSGEQNKPIYVTGSHLVYDPIIAQFVSVDNLRGAKPSRISKKHCPVLSCLITTNHTIPIGEWIFHDWEDNNGSSSKSLE